MSKKVMNNQDWLIKKLNLLKAIQAQAESMSGLPNGTAQQFEASQARIKMESFVKENGSLSRMPEQQRRKYEDLKRDFEAKDKIAKETVARYYREKSKLDKLTNELKSLQIPEYDDTFRSSGVELLIKNAVAPWLSKIKKACDVIAKLKVKRSELVKEIDSAGQDSPVLDEQSLLDADIKKLHDLNKAQKESVDKVSSIKDLIQQADQVIGEKETQLDEFRADFTYTLRYVVTQYVAVATKEMAQQFEQIMKRDSYYADNFGRVCNELIQQTGIDSADIFTRPFTVPSSLRICPLHDRDVLKDEIRMFIKEVSEYPAQHCPK